MWSQISSNRRKSMILAFVMLLVLAGLGFSLFTVYMGSDAGVIGAGFAIIVWLIMLLISYYSGDKILLASSRARKITSDDFPALYNVVEEMKIASGFSKMPDIYVMDEESPNAFAAGRDPDKSCVAVTSGLLTRLNRDELQGVIAHEMSHIVNRDVLFMTFMGVMLGSIVMLSDVFLRGRWLGGGRRSSSRGGGQGQVIILILAILFIVLAPIIAQLIYFACSRKREFLADACGAQFTRYPEGLATALEKISQVPQKVEAANRVTAPMYIVNPFAGVKKSIWGMFSTHPPIEDRVNILRGMTGRFSILAYQDAYKKVKGAGSGRMLFSAGDITTKFGEAPKGVTMEAPAAGAVAAVATLSQASAAFAPTQADPAPAAIPTQMAAVKRSHAADFFWKKEGYGIIECDCGVRLKLPPQFHSKTVMCPKCKKKFKVPGMPA